MVRTPDCIGSLEENMLNLLAFVRRNDLSMVQPQRSSMLLNKFPQELRDKIWTFTLYSEDDVVIKGPGRKFCYCRPSCCKEKKEPTCEAAMPLTAVLKTCHQIRAEASVLYYQIDTFRCIIHEHLTMTPVHWIESLSYEERKAVSMVIVELTPSNEQVRNNGNRGDNVNVSLFTQMAAVAAPFVSSFYCDRASWGRLAELMSWWRCIDLRKIVYEVKDQRQPYKY